MNTYDLKIFLEVAKDLSFSAAADELYMAQSSVSKAIKRLEDELDARLFIRKHTSVELTPCGAELNASMSRLMPEIDKTLKRIQVLAKTGPVELSYMLPPMKFNISEMLSSFSYKYPDIHVTSTHYHSLEDAADVLQEYPPLVMMYERSAFSHLYDTEVLFEDELVAVVPPKSSLSQNKTLSIREIQNELLFSTSMTTTQYIQELFSGIGIIPRILEITSGPKRETALRKVQFGHGVAILFRSDLEMFRTESLHICGIEELLHTCLVLGVLKTHSLSKEEETLVNYIVSSAEDHIYSNVL